MNLSELMAWRKSLRQELVARRMALPDRQWVEYRTAIDRHLTRAFPDLHRGIVGFCWPIRKEYDARFLIRRLRERGATAALPVVVAPGTPLVFREWHPRAEMGVGALGIPFPKHGAALAPSSILLPMNGFDRQGYRLGYGGGFFDRTLEALAAQRPLVIGVSFELAAIETIHPQQWDIPVDFVVTERGAYRRDAGAEGGRLEFLGESSASGGPA